MTIDEIKQYALAQIDALTFLEEKGADAELTAADFEHLRMRQLWLVASIAESLAFIAEDLKAIRIKGLYIQIDNAP